MRARKSGDEKARQDSTHIPEVSFGEKDRKNILKRIVQLSAVIGMAYIRSVPTALGPIE